MRKFAVYGLLAIIVFAILVIAKSIAEYQATSGIQSNMPLEPSHSVACPPTSPCQMRVVSHI